MAEALDTHELVETLNNNDAGAARPKTINDLPKELLVSIFVAINDQTWVRHTMPLVCKEWNEIYRSKDASPLHETLELNFYNEVETAKEDDDEEDEDEVQSAPRRPFVHASTVISWAQGRASSVRKLRLVLMDPHDEDDERDDDDEGDLEDFSSGDLGTLVAFVAPSLTEIEVHFIERRNKRYERQFWKSLRDFVVRAGRLRSLRVKGIDSALLGPDVEPLAQLAGSLEVLVLETGVADFGYEGSFVDYDAGLSRFPESLCVLTELRCLKLAGNQQVTAIPAAISSLKKLEVLELGYCYPSSLPKELGDLSGLTRLDLSSNPNLGSTPEDDESLEDTPSEDTLPAVEAFPAELGNMKSLRELDLVGCGLRTVPAFVCELKSLETLDLRNNNLSSLPRELGELSGLAKLVLRYNENLGNLPENSPFPAKLKKLKSLRYLDLSYCNLRAVPSFVSGLESLEVLDLSGNDRLQFYASLSSLAKGCPRLRHVSVFKRQCRDLWTPKSLENLEAFKAKLLAKNPNAWVSY